MNWLYKLLGRSTESTVLVPLTSEKLITLDEVYQQYQFYLQAVISINQKFGGTLTGHKPFYKFFDKYSKQGYRIL